MHRENRARARRRPVFSPRIIGYDVIPRETRRIVVAGGASGAIYICIYKCAPFANVSTIRSCRDNASDGLQRRWKKRSHSAAIVTAHCPLLGKSSYDLLRATDPTKAVLCDVSK